MQQSVDSSQPLEFSSGHSRFSRALLVICGAACVALPAYEFRHAFVHLGLWTVYFGIIVAGAWSIGFTLLASAVVGDTLTWTFERGSLVLTSTTLMGARREVLRAQDIEGTEIKTIEWDSRPPTYCVVVRCVTGRRIETKDLGTRAAAEALERDMRTRLGIL